MIRLLIIEPERGTRNSLQERLEYEGYHVDVTDTVADGILRHEKKPYDIMLCNYNQFKADLQQAFDSLRETVPLIVLGEETSVAVAISTLHDGAYDYFHKPYDMNRLRDSLKAARQDNLNRHAKVVREVNNKGNAPKQSGVKADSDAPVMIGNSKPMVRVRQLIDKVGPSDARVLITGPNGSGKELVARWIHEKSNRRKGPFIEVNCAAIPSELIESELFGHEKGAFTSAVKQRKGKFEQANGGTIFLDEIGDMSLPAQAKVLRALQESKITRVGGESDMEVDVRVIAATNKNLREEIEKNNFREDLYHRLSVIKIDVPSLDERRSDIKELVDYFLEAVCAEYGVEQTIDEDAVDELSRQHWSGNIRELRNVVERLVILSEDSITLDDVLAHTEH